MYTAAVITISDKGYRGERVDTSGPNLVIIVPKITQSSSIANLSLSKLLFCNSI